MRIRLMEEIAMYRADQQPPRRPVDFLLWAEETCEKLFEAALPTPRQEPAPPRPDNFERHEPTGYERIKK